MGRTWSEVLQDDRQVGGVSQAVQINVGPAGISDEEALKHFPGADIQVIHDSIEVDVAGAGWLRRQELCELQRQTVVVLLLLTVEWLSAG